MTEKHVATIKTLARYKPDIVYIGIGEYVDMALADDGDYYLAADVDAAIEVLRAEMDALEAENARLREDAERYRWLRSETSPAAEVMFHPDEDFGFYALWGDELDAAIDDAMHERLGGDEQDRLDSCMHAYEYEEALREIAAEGDTERLAFLSREPVIEEINGVKKSIYDYASVCAEECGRDVPNDEDMLNGLRRLIDAAIDQARGKAGQEVGK